MHLENRVGMRTMPLWTLDHWRGSLEGEGLVREGKETEKKTDFQKPTAKREELDDQ